MHAPRFPRRKRDRNKAVVERANKNIRKGDIVQIITGKEAASKKTGKVLKIITETNRCIVEKANMVKRHRKPTQKSPQGGIEEIESSIHLSNVKFISRGAEKKNTEKKSPEKKKTTAHKETKTTPKKKASKR